MNKLFTKIATATLGVAMAIGVGVAVGHRADAKVAKAIADETVDFTAQGYKNQQAVTSYTGTDFSVTFDKGTNNSNAPKYYTTGTAIRCYGGNYFVVSSEKTMTQIDLGFGESDGSNAITTDKVTYTNGTWTGNATSVKFTIGGSSGNRRLASIAVTFEGAATDWAFKSIVLSTGEGFVDTYEVGDEFDKTGITVSYTEHSNTLSKDRTTDVTNAATFNFDSSAAKTYKLTATYEGHTTTDDIVIKIEEPTIDYSSVTFGGMGVKITSSNASTYIASGKKIVLTHGDSKVAGAYTSKNAFDATTTSTTFSSSTITVGNGTAEVTLAVLELESSTNGFYLKLKDGTYLGTTSTSSKTGDFRKDETATTEWVVSYSGIYAYGNENYATIKVNTGTNPYRFKTYASTFSGDAVTLYSFNEYTDEALAFAETFIKGDGSSNTCAKTIENWTTLGTTFTNNLSTGAQNIFKYATHNAPETYTDSSDYSIQHCVARYDLALLAHEELRTNEFMGRVASGKLSYSQEVVTSLGNNSSNQSLTVLIIVVSSISLLAIGGLLVIRRRKEQ